MFVLHRQVIGLAVDCHGFPIVFVGLISTPTPLWVVIFVIVTLLTLVVTTALWFLLGLGVLLEIVEHLTHRPVVEHRVIDTTIGQLHDTLTCACDCAFDVLNDVIHYKVCGQVSHLGMFSEHTFAMHHLLQCNMQVLVQH